METEWKDGATSQLSMQEIKETNAVELVVYARDNTLLEEPAFAWLASNTLKK